MKNKIVVDTERRPKSYRMVTSSQYMDMDLKMNNNSKRMVTRSQSVNIDLKKSNNIGRRCSERMVTRSQHMNKAFKMNNNIGSRRKSAKPKPVKKQERHVLEEPVFSKNVYNTNYCLQKFIKEVNPNFLNTVEEFSSPAVLTISSADSGSTTEIFLKVDPTPLKAIANRQTVVQKLTAFSSSPNTDFFAMQSFQELQKLRNRHYILELKIFEQKKQLSLDQQELLVLQKEIDKKTGQRIQSFYN